MKWSKGSGGVGGYTTWGDAAAAPSLAVHRGELGMGSAAPLGQPSRLSCPSSPPCPGASVSLRHGSTSPAREVLLPSSSPTSSLRPPTAYRPHGFPSTPCSPRAMLPPQRSCGSRGGTHLVPTCQTPPPPEERTGLAVATSLQRSPSRARAFPMAH